MLIFTIVFLIAFIAAPAMGYQAVLTWGDNYYGQLGNGDSTRTDKLTPIQVNSLIDIIAVSAGTDHTLALKSNGTVWAWGHNKYGQLGNGTASGSDYDNNPTPVQVNNLTNVIAISAGNLHSLALKSDGTVWAWGRGTYGQLGNGQWANSSVPVQVSGLTNVIAIAGGGAHSLALKNDGTVRAWGYGVFGELGNGEAYSSNTPVQVTGLSNIVAIAGNMGDTSYAVKADGTAYAWGNNYYGEFGNGTHSNGIDPNPLPVQVSLTDIAAISGGGYHTIARKNDGTVWAWGYNSDGQIGDSTTTTSYVPVQVSGMSNVVAIDGGTFHTIALKSDGTVWIWGRNYDGQLGNGTSDFNPHPLPVQVNGITNLSAVAAGQGHSLIIGPDITPPTGSITINSGNAYTKLSSVTLNLNCDDGNSTACSEMSLSSDGVFDTEPWETYASTKAWTLSSGEGTKTVYVKFKDTVGNWSSAYSDTITLDTTVPTGTISINSGATYATSTSVTLTLTCSDANGCSQMQFSNDNSTWSTAESYATSKTWTLLSGDGTKTVYAKFKDTAGNWSTAYSDTIILDAAISGWTIEAVDAPKYFTAMSQRSIAIDKVTHQPHIAYGGDHLYHAFYNGTGWEYETVDSSPRVGQNASIAIDSNNKVHISYLDGTNYDLKYATNVSGSWVTSTIDSTGDVGPFTSIAIDSNNKVHISYINNTNYDLKYATNTSGSWSTATIDSAGNVSAYTSIAIDSNGKVHISYYEGDPSISIKYATNASGSWAISTIDSTGYIGYYSSMALDSNNKVHISYLDGINYDLKYATNASGSWVKYTIDSAGDVGSYSSIAIDSNNKIHISYTCGSGCYDLKYATNTSGSWITSTIDSAGDVGDSTSIALDSNNKVHIYYLDYRIGDLKYATNTSGSWVTSTIDTTRDVGISTSIALDSNNKVHISYSDSTNGDLKFATNTSGSWVTSIIDSAGNVGRYTSIATDSNNKVHISYYDYTNSDLKYATNASGSWVISTIDSTGNVGEYTSIAIDSNNKVHISYSDSTNGDLKFATNTSGSWVTSIIDSAGNVGRYTSIATDSNNKVHISYYDYTNSDLKYATNTSGSWVTSTIDSVGSIGDYSSIAIDSNNKVHISYQDYTNRDLKYATNASGSWVIFTVDSSGDVGSYSSIAIDSNNKVHISYYDYTNFDLKHATNASGSWVISTIDSTGNVGGYTSIAVDSNNKVYISYYDYTNYDLKYAMNPDMVSPATTATPAGGAYNSAQSVTLTCNDSGGSGCDRTYYCLSSGCTPATEYIGAIDISTSTDLRFYSTDLAGNNSAPIKTETYIIDTTGPSGSISINSGAVYTSSTSVTLTLNCSDANGCSEMQFSNDNITFSTPITNATTASWTLSSGDGTKTVYVKFKDNAGNWSGAYSDTIVLDTTAPTGTVSISSGATYTTSTSVPLSFTCSDSLSGCNNIQVSNDNATWSSYGTIQNWTTWEIGSWQLTSGDGTKTVYVKIEDIAGNWSGVYSDTIILDTINPTATITSPINGAAVIGTTYTITGNASDIGSSIQQVEVSTDGGATWNLASGTTSWSYGWTLPADGTYTIKSRATDSAGNVETSGAGVTVTIAVRQPIPVTVSGRQILVNGNPFTIKGIGYSPVPIGIDPETIPPYGDYFTSDQSAIHDRDLPLLRQLGANTIRLWGWNDTANHLDFLDKAYNNGVNPIYVIAGFWINAGRDINPSSPSNEREQIKEEFRQMVAAQKNHPAILIWAIGNELNASWMYGSNLNNLFSLIEELAGVAHTEEGANHHPVTTPLMDSNLINIISTYNASVPSLDIWGANVYRGNTFGTLFSDYQAVSAKPLVILEYEIDSYDNVTGAEYENIGTPYQAEYARTLWNEIAANSATCVGGSIMEYSDEWWKGKYSTNAGCPDNDPASHSLCGYAATSHPDGYSNEEWWGIMRTKDNGTNPDIMELRAVYYELRYLWTGVMQQYTLTVTKTGTGSGNVVSADNLINCGIDCSENYNSGTSVTLTASPDSGSTFAGWSGNTDCTDGSVTMDTDKICTATFTLNTYTVTTIATNGTITSTVNPTVNHGSTTTVTGSANVNYYFTDVSGCGGITQNNTNQSITSFSYNTGAITEDCTVTANFAGIPNISSSPTSLNFGNVTLNTTSTAQTVTVSNTGTGNLNISTVSLAGTDSTQFLKQVDTCSGNTVVSTLNCQIQIAFRPTSAGAKAGTLSIPSDDPDTAILDIPLSGNGISQYNLTVQKTGSGTVTATGINCGSDCSEPYSSGASVTLTATADTGSTFTGWTGCDSVSGDTCDITMNSEKTITAEFISSALYVVWADDTYGNNEIFLKKSTDNGATWTFQRLTNNIGNSQFPVVAVSGNDVYVVWQDDTYAAGVPEIFLKKSTDGGNTWAFQRLTTNTGNSQFPAVAVSGNNVYAVWQDDTYATGVPEIFLKKSIDGGNTWTFQRLTTNTGVSMNPSIAVNGNNVYVVWQDDTYGPTGVAEIFLKRSADSGATWQFQRMTTNAGYSGRPSMAVDGSNIYVVWPDDTYGNYEIFLKKSTDGGSTWLFQRLTTNAGISGRPSIALSSGNLYVVWEDDTYGPSGVPEIFMKKSINGGNTWTFQRLTTNTGISVNPSIRVNGTDVYAVWQDDTYGPSGVPEIFLKRSTDSGATWQFQRLTTNTGISAMPAIMR